MRLPAVLSLALLGWSVVANLILGDLAYVSRNLALAAGLLALAWWAGASARDLGVQRSRIRAGAGWGLGASVVVAVVLIVAVALAEVVAPIGALLADERAAQPESEIVHAMLVRIPFGTAVFEEVAFRGVLLGLLLRATSAVRAVAISSVVFGVWHVPPTLVTLTINDMAWASSAAIGAVLGAVVVTTIAGVIFAWLRLRSGSVLAPILAHWATNALGLLAAASTTVVPV
jgi:uncharacterized protein